MRNDWDHLNEARQRLIDKYKMKFNNGFKPGSKAPIHKRVLDAYINCEGREFVTAGIWLVIGKTNSKVIAERGHWEMFTPQLGQPNWEYKRTSETIIDELMIKCNELRKDGIPWDSVYQMLNIDTKNQDVLRQKYMQWCTERFNVIEQTSIDLTEFYA